LARSDIECISKTVHNLFASKKYEILEQQIATSKLEGIHNCADRTDKFVGN
jgi:hypothetical protein